MPPTEAQWLELTDIAEIVKRCRGKLIGRKRKLRLFAVACCRQIWSLLGDARSRRAVEVAEQYAEGQISEQELRDVESLAMEAHQTAFDVKGKEGALPEWAAVFAAWFEPLKAAEAAGWMAEGSRGFLPFPGEPVISFLRDIFGNPFRPVTVDPAWRTTNVVGLAQAIYDERAFDRMPILADALEEAGCANGEVLDHCRGPGPHVRGCWVLDLLRGRE
jgi:hypothetical protein